MSKSRVAEHSAAYALQAAMEPVCGSSFDLLATALQGVANLRRLILSFAIRGKLVPQNAADGSASLLLKRVHEERMELRTRRALKRKTTELVDHDEEWAELPESWAWSCLANIGVINPRNDVSDDTEASFVQMSSVPVALLEPHKSERRPWREIKSGFTHFAEGDVGVAKITPCFENGKSTVFRNLDSGVGAGTTELHVVRPLASISSDYILSFLKSPEFLLLGEKGMTGSAGQKRLSRHYFETRAFPLPPLAEQARIVARVEELMQLCDALEAHGRLQDEQHARLVATLFDALAASESADALAENWQRIATHFDLLLDRPAAVDTLEQTLLQLAVRGLLVLQDPGDEPASELLCRLEEERDHLLATGEIKRDRKLPTIEDDAWTPTLPIGWSLARLGSLANFIDYRGRTPVKTSEGVPLITAKNVRMGYIDRQPREFIASDQYSSWMTRGIPRTGDLLFTTEAPLGKVAAIDISGRFALAQRVICLGMFEPRMSEFLKYLLMSADMQAEFSRQATGVTAQGIKSARLQLVVVPVPPLAEQHRIVARVEQLRTLCAKLRVRLQQSRTTQSHLADALVSAAQSPAC